MLGTLARQLTRTRKEDRGGAVRDRVRVGFPRSLTHYLQGNYWRRFVQLTGAKWVVSPSTDAQIWRDAVSGGDDDLCLPVRAYCGHAAYLAPRTDLLLVPRVVRMEPGAHMCPLLLGLPDLVRSRLDGVQVLAPRVCADEVPARFRRRLARAAQFIGACRADGRSILQTARMPRRTPRSLSEPVRVRLDRLRPDSGRPQVAVLGHPYLLADDYLNLDLMHRFVDCGVEPIVSDWLSPGELEPHLDPPAVRPYWSEGARMLAAARCLVRRGVEGMVHVSAFGCGCDSFMGYELEARMRKWNGPPLLRLVLDEHTAEAGLATRLEAYCDMIRGRRDAG